MQQIIYVFEIDIGIPYLLSKKKRLLQKGDFFGIVRSPTWWTLPPSSGKTN